MPPLLRPVTRRSPPPFSPYPPSPPTTTHAQQTQVFDKVDVNNNRQIEAIEAEVAILSLYNVVNKRVPGWQDPPSRARIMESLKVFDKDGDGALNKDEFFYFSKDLLKNGPVRGRFGGGQAQAGRDGGGECATADAALMSGRPPLSLPDLDAPTHAQPPKSQSPPP